jgi:hypothetical protein
MGQGRKEEPGRAKGSLSGNIEEWRPLNKQNPNYLAPDDTSIVQLLKNFRFARRLCGTPDCPTGHSQNEAFVY